MTKKSHLPLFSFDLKTSLGLGWRFPLYRRYLYYMYYCNNYADIIRYDREKKPFTNFRVRKGTKILFNNLEEAHSVFQEIWINQVYTKTYRPSRKPKMVVDIGANIGMFSFLANFLWPTAEVLAFEPALNNYKTLIASVGASVNKNITAYNLAVSNEVETVDFFVSNLGTRNSIYKDLNRDDDIPKSISTVKAISIDEILEKAGGHIDFLKIDCEGAEWSILPGHEAALQKVSYVAMEYHIPRNKQLNDLVGIFERAGFDVTMQSPFPWGDWTLGFLYATNRSG
jgi:FkbM family methyltransferase